MFQRTLVGWSIVLLSILVMPSEAQTVTSIGSLGDTLTERWESAIDTTSPDGNWIVFSFDRTMCEGCMIGSFGGLNREKSSTIGTVLTGESFADDSVEKTARRAIEQIDGAPDRMVRKRMAVILDVDSRSDLLDVDFGTFDSVFNFEERGILWLGSVSPEETLMLMSKLYDVDLSEDAKRGLTWAIGSVPLPEAVLPLLERIMLGNESDEVRKAATYAIGGLNTASSVESLQRIIADDPSDEIRKAAIYGLGNSESSKARSALLSIIKTMGSNR